MRHDMSAWRGYRGGGVPAAWHVVEGTIRKDAETEDIVTKDEYGDFELEIDWKIGTAGNSGIFYRGTEEYDHIYWSAPEYQLLDDANAPDGRSRLTAAGSDYGLYPAPPGILKPANEWNTTRIVVQGNNVEHWLNGQMLLAYEFGSVDWLAKVKGSKFAAWLNYGKAKRGHIGIQGDHTRNAGAQEHPHQSAQVSFVEKHLLNGERVTFQNASPLEGVHRAGAAVAGCVRAPGVLGGAIGDASCADCDSDCGRGDRALHGVRPSAELRVRGDEQACDREDRRAQHALGGAASPQGGGDHGQSEPDGEAAGLWRDCDHRQWGHARDLCRDSTSL